MKKASRKLWTKANPNIRKRPNIIKIFTKRFKANRIPN
jgi:hypothetical protein